MHLHAHEFSRAEETKSDRNDCERVDDEHLVQLQIGVPVCFEPRATVDRNISPDVLATEKLEVKPTYKHNQHARDKRNQPAIVLYH